MYPLDGENPKYLVVVCHTEYDPTGIYPYVSLEKAKEEYAKHAQKCQDRFLVEIIEQGV